MSALYKKERKRNISADLEMGKYTMGIAVKLTGVQAYRIRRFEEAGLLTPERTKAGQRLFSDIEIELIKEVAKLEDKKINLEGVKVILSMKSGEVT